MESDEKICPFCAETIKKAALKCKHCGSQLDEPVEPPGATPAVLTQKKGKSGCLWLIAAAVAGMVIFLGYGVHLSNTPEGKRKTRAEDAYNLCQKNFAEHIGSDGEKRIIQGACRQLKEEIDNPKASPVSSETQQRSLVGLQSGPTSSDTPLRSSPSISAPVIDPLKRGSVVTVYKQTTGWVRISPDGEPERWLVPELLNWN